MTDQAWYIDSLDGLGGLAFASHRTADLTSSKLNLDGPAWVISAPDFHPEPVASRAIGFAASHRGLQLGLSLEEDTELAFPNLEALADFVRRLYLSGGGGDGSGETTPPDDTPPPSGTDDREYRPQEISSALQPYASRIFELADRHVRASAELEKSEEVCDAVAPLALLSKPRKADREHDALDLVDHLVGSELRHLWSHALPNNEEELQRLRRAMASYEALINALQIKTLGSFRPYHTLHHDDMLDALARLPIPNRVKKTTNALEDWHNVKDLFYGLLGNPRLFVQTPFAVERVVLFLFAAAAIASRGQQDWPVFLGAVRPNSVGVLRESLVWLRGQMPTTVFRPDIEDLIQGFRRGKT